MAEGSAKRRRAVTQSSVETGMAGASAEKTLRVPVDGWTVMLEWSGGGRPTARVERAGGFTLVHFTLPAGPVGDYSVSVRQPFVDIHRSWAGTIDCWRGTELASIALNYSFSTALNQSLPALCNYSRAGVNRGVVGLLDHAPRTQVSQRPVFEDPPLHLLQTRFTRRRAAGGGRETVVIYRGRTHFAEAVQRWLAFCRARAGITPLPAPDWAREPVWCSWYSNLYKLTQRQVEAQVPHLARLGFRTVLIDASWFQSKDHDVGCQLESGEYLVNRAFFPDFPGLARRLRDEGLRLMLWCAPLFAGTRAGNRAALAPFCTWDGRERSSVLCPFCPEALAHARALMTRLVGEYRLDGVKLDFMDAGLKESEDRPFCLDPAHDHGGRDYGAAMAGFMGALRDAVLAVNPGAAIEYRLRYSTVATLPFANCHRGNDAPYDADYLRRENLFLRLFCARRSAVWSDYAYWHAREKPANVSLMLGGQVFSGGVPTVSVDLAACDASHRRVIARWFRFYRRHREALARAELKVHSADSAFSVSSLRDAKTGDAFVLLAGQHIPARLALTPGVRRAWLFNMSAERRGAVTLTAGKTSAAACLAGPGPAAMSLEP